ncbi:hypothetical protein DAPPUDRAFT_245691 [Daphnia pulex]|uniref:CUB domain-containing protein n=1 Tax=Daphnia pulex TaxID=6669 RepID=E9GNV3_DAPPU|nr:hypothetical protein DAPPUDRAFT_245691 [Daphnia pulex]|eukprot:EFX78884.1 hypothetical protein DAPPUDRAFT_245691 [Daphnia pulex]
MADCSVVGLQESCYPLCARDGGDCGSCKNVTEDGGIIESPNFPDEYSSNLSCLFTINAPPEKKINLTFTEVSVKECCDFITAYCK